MRTVRTRSIKFGKRAISFMVFPDGPKFQQKKISKSKLRKQETL